MDDQLTDALRAACDPAAPHLAPLHGLVTDALVEIENLRDQVVALVEHNARDATEISRLRSQVAQLLPWADTATRPTEWDGAWEAISLADGDIGQSAYDSAAAWRGRRDTINARIRAGEFGDVAAAMLREAQAAGVTLDREAFVDVWPQMTDDECLELYQDAGFDLPGEGAA
jgi:hypothetical protein